MADEVPVPHIPTYAGMIYATSISVSPDAVLYTALVTLT